MLWLVTIIPVACEISRVFNVFDYNFKLNKEDEVFLAW